MMKCFCSFLRPTPPLVYCILFLSLATGQGSSNSSLSFHCSSIYRPLPPAVPLPHLSVCGCFSHWKPLPPDISTYISSPDHIYSSSYCLISLLLESHLYSLPEVSLFSFSFKPSPTSVLPPSVHKNYTCQVLQWPLETSVRSIQYCQIQWSSLSPYLVSSVLYSWSLCPLEFLLLVLEHHSLWFSFSVTDFSFSVPCVGVSLLVHFGALQGAALELGLFSVPQSLGIS